MQTQQGPERETDTQTCSLFLTLVLVRATEVTTDLVPTPTPTQSPSSPSTHPLKPSVDPCPTCPSNPIFRSSKLTPAASAAFLPHRPAPQDQAPLLHPHSTTCRPNPGLWELAGSGSVFQGTLGMSGDIFDHHQWPQCHRHGAGEGRGRCEQSTMLTAAPRRSSPSKTPGVSRLAKPGFHGGFDEFLISASLIMGTRKCSESVEYCRKNAPLTHQKDMCEWKEIHGFDRIFHQAMDTPDL